MTTNGIDTPALLVDRGVLQRNIEDMQALADRFGVALRPHTKTHKSPKIAWMQIRAGARGITVAKLGEAEVMADAGIEDILIANQIVGQAKKPRLMELAGRVRLAVLVDSEPGVAMLGRACAEADIRLDVMIEVDTGKKRCGLRRLPDILALAETVGGFPHLRLRGIETHEGHVAAGAEDAGDIRGRAIRAGQRMVEVASALASEGHAVDEVSVGSTPAAPYTCEVEGVTGPKRAGRCWTRAARRCSPSRRAPASLYPATTATVISKGRRRGSPA